jgi:hypothetical protein
MVKTSGLYDYEAKLTFPLLGQTSVLLPSPSLHIIITVLFASVDNRFLTGPAVKPYSNNPTSKIAVPKTAKQDGKPAKKHPFCPKPQRKYTKENNDHISKSLSVNGTALNNLPICVSK